jgi:hypothetical protein
MASTILKFEALLRERVIRHTHSQLSHYDK